MPFPPYILLKLAPSALPASIALAGGPAGPGPGAAKGEGAVIAPMSSTLKAAAARTLAAASGRAWLAGRLWKKRGAACLVLIPWS
jgi:hypothetical protein